MRARKLAPILHSIRTFPSMILETAHIPFHSIRQERDWKTLCARFPGMHSYLDQVSTIKELLRPAHHDYITHFSSPLISLSLNRAAFLFFFSKIIHAQYLLDLGSGFSSYVFSLYVRQAGSGTIVSVDDTDFWLMETKRFLEKYGIETQKLWPLSQYRETRSTLPGADLCLLDIGDFAMRQSLLPDLLEDVKQHSMYLIVDDFHVPAYRKCIMAMCKEKEVKIYSLRKVTKRRLSHMALIMK